jgi:hypothetical protein
MSSFFEAEGFAIERLARLPYLSRGDSRAPYYVLDDGLWVLRRDQRFLARAPEDALRP